MNQRQENDFRKSVADISVKYPKLAEQLGKLGNRDLNYHEIDQINQELFRLVQKAGIFD